MVASKGVINVPPFVDLTRSKPQLRMNVANVLKVTTSQPIRIHIHGLSL